MGTAGGHDDEQTIPPTGSDAFSLPIGTRLDEFELTHKLGEGGFGIVYLAWDHTLERRVALKEYMPASLSTRHADLRVSVRSERQRETFEAGMKSFINEAKLLASFDHPSLVKVYRFWQGNGTAYMVMPFYEGLNLRETVRAMPEPPGEAWLLEVVDSLTQALAVIHAERCYHRDIAPDNVMMLAETGKPLLLDFGAARRVIGDMTQALTVILKPGYAPVEQYDEVEGMKQGPWTDVYALAAVVYWAISGKTPPPAVGRMMRDSCVPLAALAAGRYSEPFLQAFDRALAVLPEQRTPGIDVLRDELGLPPAVIPRRPGTRAMDPEATVIRPLSTAAPGFSQRPLRSGGSAGASGTAGAAATTGRMTTGAATQPALGPQVSADPAGAPSAPTPVSPRAGPKPWALVGGLVAAVLLALAGWWATRGGAEPGLPPAAATPSAPAASLGPGVPSVAVPAAAPAAASASASTGVSASSPAGASAATSAPAPASASASAPAPAPVSSARPSAPSRPAATPQPATATAARATKPPVPGPSPITLQPSASAPLEPAAVPRVKPHEPKRPRAAGGTAGNGDSSEAKDHAAKCARLMQRMSLGDGGSEVAERYKALGCR